MKPRPRPEGAAGDPAGEAASRPAPPGTGSAAEQGEPLSDRHVVLCVTGGIAAYKSAYLTRALVKSGARVRVVMSANAQRFVAPLTFETLSGNPVVTSSFERVHEMGAVEHIDLATWAELAIVAPATYDLIGKLHAGIADDAVTTLLTAMTCPVFIAPAMNDLMWRNPVNQRNVDGLRHLGYHIVDPERGGLACSWEGEGRMREPDAILAVVRAGLAASASAHGTPHAQAGGGAAAGMLAGRTVLVSAAGTHEAIDPVRFIGNRSSGKMGYALAAAAVSAGARVLLVTGPSHVTVPAGVAEVRRVESAAEMLAALGGWVESADVLLMAAAVADYRPTAPATGKLKRTAAPLRLDLEPTPDILQALRVSKGHRLFVGFALETEDVESAARGKLHAKGLDLVVANRVGSRTGPDADTNQVWIYDAQGLVLATPLEAKNRIAATIIDVVARRLVHGEASANVRV